MSAKSFPVLIGERNEGEEREVRAVLDRGDELSDIGDLGDEGDMDGTKEGTGGRAILGTDFEAATGQWWGPRK